MRTSSLRWLAGGAVILALGWAAAAYSQTPAPGGPMPDRRSADRKIVVTGDGAVEAVPDRAIVTLALTVVRPTAQDAQRQSAAAMAQIVKQVLGLGLPQSAVRTTTVSLTPQRQPQSGGMGPITGYEADNRVAVTVDDIARVGQIIDTGVAAGANGVDGLEWELRDPAASNAQALRLAVQNAQATAAAIASAAGVTGLRLVRIDQVGAAPVPRFGVALAAAPATPVLPGTLSVTQHVRAVFAF
jgi:uncharacterized protein YggE